MCGIFGFTGTNDLKLLKKMGNVIKYRGPDDVGYYIDNFISMGVRRLSIIDLKTGHQPIHNEDESLWIVFNGEIYNYKDLRDYLVKKGHKFYTKTDTEVILHAFEEYGPNCVQKLNGMFGFAIWDSKNNSLFIARDRIGIKPVHYALINNELFFASEIKSILENKNYNPKVSDEGLNALLSYRFVPAPLTMFEGIKKLKPGCYLIFKDKKITIKKYWYLSINPVINNEKEALKKIENLFSDSVKKRLISDVPLGSFLSGGIDSSSIVAFMSKYASSPVKTFSVGFGDKNDELSYARKVSEVFNTEHYELLVTSETSKFLEKLTWHLDEPLADATIIPTYLISKFARKYVKVVLSGEGGDELFAGYKKYIQLLRLNNLTKVVPYRIKQKFPIISKNPVVRRFCLYLKNSNNICEGYNVYSKVFDEEEKKELFRKNISNNKLNIYPRCKLPNLNSILLFDINYWLPDDLLIKGDRMMMAASIEGRFPFLDHRFVEYCVKIHPRMKIKGFQSKYLLKKLMKNKLPKEIIRRRKQGFTVPIKSWLKNELNDLAEELLLDKNIRRKPYFNNKFVQKVVNNYKRKGNVYYRRQFWTLLMFELWYKIFIKD